MKRVALVYQGGIANVFELGPQDFPELPGFVDPESGRKLLLQHAFDPCLWYARGLKAAGVEVLTFACNRVGDIAGAEWTADLESQPFADKLRRV